MNPESERESWMPLAAVAAGQIQFAWNFAAIPVSIGGIVESFDVSPTMVSAAVVLYSITVAGLILSGGKAGEAIGSKLAFRVGTVGLMAATLLAAFSPSLPFFLAAQALAGISAAASVPAFIALIADHYRDAQRQQALGVLGGVQAAGMVGAFFLAGAAGTWLGWRWAFGMATAICAITLALSFFLKESRLGVRSGSFDWAGAVLAALAAVLLGLGVHGLSAWGWCVAREAAPFTIGGLSPALPLAGVGVVCIQLLFRRSSIRRRLGHPAILAPELFASREGRASVIGLHASEVIGSGLLFLVPLSIQILQGRSSFATSVAVVPFQLAMTAGAVGVGILGARVVPGVVGRIAFALMAAGLLLLALEMQASWGDAAVIAGLVAAGLGQGAVLTALTGSLLSAVPRELSSDAGAVRGAVLNLSAGLGTALAALLATSLLAVAVERKVAAGPPSIRETMDAVATPDQITFVTDAKLEEVLVERGIEPASRDSMLAMNAEARRIALKFSFLCFSVLALVAVVPSGLAGRAPAPRIPRKGAATDVPIAGEPDSLGHPPTTLDHPPA